MSETIESGKINLADVQKRADENGCYMQMFVAFNPDTGMFVLACNDPSAANGGPAGEAAMLAALVIEHVSAEANEAAARVMRAVQADVADKPATVN